MQRKVIAIVKAITVCLVIAAGSLLFVSYKTQKMYADLWQQLGISKVEGSKQITQSFISGYLHHYGARNIKKIAQGDRVAVAKDLLNYTKQYVNTEAFKKEYESQRQSSKPIAPEPAKTEEQIRKEEVAKMKESIKRMEEAVKTGPAEYKKMYEDNLKLQQQQLKDYQDPNNKTVKYQVQSEQQNYEYNVKRYEKRMKEWEENFPANPNLLIKKRLQEMLDITKDVDFNAELVEKYGKKRFVKPEYERKHNNWKYAFRAGKEVTETVRAFAEQWLKEIK